MQYCLKKEIGNSLVVELGRRNSGCKQRQEGGFIENSSKSLSSNEIFILHRPWAITHDITWIYFHEGLVRDP